MWTTRKELEAVLAQVGLGEWSPRLAAAARQAMILEPGPIEEGADAPIGASRLGGTPDLPAEVPWPWRPALPNRVFKDHAARPWPLSFVAQIDFAEILSAGGLEGFPSSGRLLFFCDPILSSIGVSMGDQACAAVMFFAEHTDRLGRRDFPVEFSDPGPGTGGSRYFMFRPRRVTPKLWLLPPPFGSRELLALHGAPPPPDTKTVAPWPPRMRWGQEHEAYHQFWMNLAEAHPNVFASHGAIHQVGGIPFPWQDPLETDCVKYADDDYLNHPTLKAFHERMDKDGPPFKCLITRKRAKPSPPSRPGSARRTSRAPTAGSTCCKSRLTPRSGRGLVRAASTSVSGRAI